jgi:hypothetical protein
MENINHSANLACTALSRPVVAYDYIVVASTGSNCVLNSRHYARTLHVVRGIGTVCGKKVTYVSFCRYLSYRDAYLALTTATTTVAPMPIRVFVPTAFPKNYFP